MKLVDLAASVGLFAACVHALAISPPAAEVEAIEALAALRRALPNSPKGYTPSFVDCPTNAPSARSASSLSPNETAWLEKRRNVTLTPMRNFLHRVNISGFDAGSYIDRHAKNASALPNIGIAVSGGGWRALQNGAGAVQAFDSRTANSTSRGHLGGLLQSATYIAGLSGGSWLVGSIYVNNFTTVTALRDNPSGSLWEFGNSVLEGPDTGGVQIFDTAEYYTHLVDDILGKENAGFDLSITDIWGRALSYQLINATDGGPSYTWSSIALTKSFQNAELPFPIIIADERAPGEHLVSANTTIYEFNPYEMGTWDPTAYGFVPMQYLGTNFTNGLVPDHDQCVIGFDNAGYIMGTSSTLFNQGILEFNASALPDLLAKLITNLLQDLGEDNNDIADYTPNPFFHYNRETNLGGESTRLTLVDGGEDLQNIPLHPLIQPIRHVDVIFAVDSSADTTYNWPNATALVATYERSQKTIANGTNFPSIPDQNTIVNLGLNTHPTFFGCNTSNMTDGINTPLIVYIPNSPYVTLSNESTFTLTTNDTYRDAIILNGYNVATMGNGTAAEDWPTCVGCAILSRSLERTGTTVPDVCTQCFQRFCWDGTLNATHPAEYEPVPSLEKATLSSSASTLRIFSRKVWTSLTVAGAAAAFSYS